MWPGIVFNFAASLFIAGLFLRAVRRLERRVDARCLRFDTWATAEEAKFIAERDSVDFSHLTQSFKAIVEATLTPSQVLVFDDVCQSSADTRSNKIGNNLPNRNPNANGTTSELIWAEVEKLPEPYRLVMILVLLDLGSSNTLNLSDIARQLHIAPSTAHERFEGGMIRLGIALRERQDVQAWLNLTSEDLSFEDLGPVARLGRILHRGL